MKTKAIYIALIFVLAISTVAMAASVEPQPWPKDEKWFPGGGAGIECDQIGDYMYGYKIDEWNEYSGADGDYLATFDDGHQNMITILNSTGYKFDWSADPNPIGAVIVKASTTAQFYEYSPQVFSDTELMSPVNYKNGKQYAISHVTFCWNPEEDMCYQKETAWADGTRYVDPGNWATYTPYPTDPVTFFAGQTIEAGIVSFSEVVDGKITITVDLNEGWSFAYIDEEGTKFTESLHIEGYTSVPGAKNPAPGKFVYKFKEMGNLAVVEVPAGVYVGDTFVDYMYFGVHAAVQKVVPCQ